ncbi:hypothetical protein [Alkalihalobacillus trypoxylicola]|uniref:Replicative helicase inhibitor G39P N-terminal domain-containing protein n=1 Tax=Alkalihalobacillus trypoxylicola TaxID=519424 RepID=A0A161P7T6_9BACI|nr:hypothetical protein [Alkalihalobacillus trypoxylicola]KYG28148.1 hypothetical protein AZF04_09600 [Alkalihalobacillus trypoxylicola]
MLTKSTFQDGMNKLLIFYPHWNINLEESEIAIAWYQKFLRFDDSSFQTMVDKYIESETYVPTVAGLNKYKPNPRFEKNASYLDKVVEMRGF